MNISQPYNKLEKFSTTNAPPFKKCGGTFAIALGWDILSMAIKRRTFIKKVSYVTLVFVFDYLSKRKWMPLAMEPSL